MYQRTLIFFIGITGLLAWAILYTALCVKEEDRKAFAHLTERHAILRKQNVLDTKPCVQKRKGVVKDFWGDNFHARLEIDESKMVLRQKNKKTIFEEKMSGIKAVLNNPAVIVEAKEGFFARNENRLDLGQIHLVNEEYIMDADRGVAHLQHAFKPLAVTLTGNVKTIALSHESYALADRLLFDCEKKTLLMSSEPKVLFWQKGTTLTAPEIVIHKDQTIEAKGEVHCSFSPEEKTMFETLFKPYLKL